MNPLRIHEILTALGYDAGPPTATMTDRLRDAVRQFQRDRRLLVDGIVGPKTEGALNAAEQQAQGQILDPVAFAAWAPDALPRTVEALEAAARAYPALLDRNVLDDWLGQMWVESKGFSTMVESLNYSVEGLRKTFGKHRISDAECERHGRKPGRPADQQAIANILYGGEWGRKNLGNTQPTDGWDFRGSGFKQITGRRNVTASGFTADELRTDVFKSALAAAKFFVDAGCVAPAQRGDITAVTKKINGGNLGLALRAQKTASARSVIR